MEWPSFNISNSLSILEKQEKEYMCSPLRKHILSLKLGLRFLEIFINVSSNEDLDLRIKRAVYDVWREIHSLSDRPTNGLQCLILDLDCEYTNLLEKMKNVIIKPETGEYDVIFPKLYSWNPFLKTTNDFLLESFGDLSSCNADLVAPRMKEIEDIKEKLMHLQALLTYIADTGVQISKPNKKFLIPLVALLDKAACLLYSCLVDKMDEEEMRLSMKNKLSDLLENINVKKIYIMVLRASRVLESTDNVLESEFYVLDNLLKLLDSNTSSVSFQNEPGDELHNQGSLVQEALTMQRVLKMIRSTLGSTLCCVTLYFNKRLFLGPAPRLSVPSEKLHGKLKFLKLFLADLPHELRVEKFNYLLTSIEAIICNAIPILYSCYVKDLKEDMAREVNGALDEVIDQIEDIQAEIKEIKPYSYPKTDGLGFLDLFLEHLEDLLKCRPELIEFVRNQVEALYVNFYFLRSFLRIIKEQHDQHEELGDFWKRIIGLAYQAEYAIDFYLVKSPLDPRITLSLSKIIEEAKVIKSEVKVVCYEVKYHTQAHDAVETFSHVTPRAINTATDEVVGFQDEAEKITEYLFRDQPKLYVVAIVGMPGLGKTTLAKKMYESPLIIEYFDVRAWCYVSQTYRKRDLLLTILRDVVEFTDEILELNDEELAAKLYKSLKGRRYLIVLDDIWDIKAWNDLVRSLPDDRNHSCILITSRLEKVASQIKDDSKLITLRQFNDDESWELFKRKLFSKQSFPDNLLEVGKQIVKNCNGLPLSIVVIAGILAKMEKSVDKWKQIAASLSSHIFSDLESQCMAILELSYNQLPDHLKSCFLYIGAFPEGKDIPVSKLKLLWIAEGFVRCTKAKSLEDVAEMYFMDLISRSLVITTKERSLGGVKACRLHDLLRDFCWEKVKEESFLQVIRVDHWIEFSRVYDQRRLSIHSTMNHLIIAEPFGYSVRSLLHYEAMEYYTFYRWDVSFIFKNFKLLKVLDLACISVLKSLSGIEALIHLRYLAIDARVTSIPPSIAKLCNLQYFLVKANGLYEDTQMVEVPDSLWDMVNLRHVHINHRAWFYVEDSRLQNSSLLDNLETLSTPWFFDKEKAENLLRRLPKLRKLRCVFVNWIDLLSDSDCIHFPALDFLSQLMSLKLFLTGVSHQGQRCEFKFPPSLQKLTLSWCKLQWDDISKFGRTLRNLKVLKLYGDNWDETWIVNDGDFPQLKYLKLSKLENFREWIASEGSFRMLEQLVLENCRNLNEIPPCFGEIPTLGMITVIYCQPSVDDSAREIEVIQKEEWQNAEFKVNIYPMEQVYENEEEH